MDHSPDASATVQSSLVWRVVNRINLDHLQNADEAVRVVRATQSIDGAKMVAK